MLLPKPCLMHGTSREPMGTAPLHAACLVVLATGPKLHCGLPTGEKGPHGPGLQQRRHCGHLRTLLTPRPGGQGGRGYCLSALT